MSGAFGGNDAEQMRIFNERIARVEKRLVVSQAEAKRSARRRKPARTQGGMLSHLLALGTGGLAVVASRLIRALVFDAQLNGADATMAMMNDAALALAVAFLVKAMFHFNLTQFALLQGSGAAAMLLGMHNLVHLAPELFGRVFPAHWVSQVLATTEPHSLLIQGASVMF
jgi:type IV secretory pathway TrbD component